MDSFQIMMDIRVDLKVKSAQPDSMTWYLINLEHMMMMMGSENMSPTGAHDEMFGGVIYPMKLNKNGLHYYDQVSTTWHLLEERVQREFSDYIADKEILGICDKERI